jgi:hypothetical protein
LEGGPPIFRQDFSCPALLEDRCAGFPYGAVTRCGAPFQALPVPNATAIGLFRFRSPLLAESRLMSVPPATEMFQFAGFASRAYEFSAGYPLPGGLPHSDTPGSTIARISPGLFAACRVLHRLSVPRHPPDALNSRPIPKRPRAARPSPDAHPRNALEPRRAQGQAPPPRPVRTARETATSRDLRPNPRAEPSRPAAIHLKTRLRTARPQPPARRFAPGPPPAPETVRLGHLSQIRFTLQSTPLRSPAGGANRARAPHPESILVFAKCHARQTGARQTRDRARTATPAPGTSVSEPLGSVLSSVSPSAPAHQPERPSGVARWRCPVAGAWWR